MKLKRIMLATTLTVGLGIIPTGVSASETKIDNLQTAQHQEGTKALEAMKELINKPIDQIQLKKDLEQLKIDNPQKYNDVIKQIQNENSKASTTASAMGTVGDILVSYDSGIMGWNYGHAALVRKNNAYIVEAMPSDGVRSYTNNWGTRYSSKKKMYVSGAQQADYDYAVSWAVGRIGAPYSLTTTKDTINEFYCSKLVWQAWKKATGFDLDADGGVWVYPVDLERSPKTVVY